MITNDQNHQTDQNIPHPADLSTVAMPATPAPGPEIRRHEGTLIAYFETGTEGLIWAMAEDGKQGYDGLKIVDEGDHLLITAPDDTVLFDGVVEMDCDSGKQPRFPGDPYGQPVAQGYRVHWTQKGWLPDDWAALFIPEVNRAILTKRTESTTSRK